MAITAGQQAVASDFVATSAGAGDSGKVPKLNGDGNLDASFSKQASVQTFVTPMATMGGDSTTRFDITNPAGTTWRYTYDGTGTDPVINATTLPIGTKVLIYSTNFNANNNGFFTVTGSGANYFEITNASGVAQADITLGGAGAMISKGATWTKPSGLKYIVVEGVGGGGKGGDASTSGSLTAAGGGAAGGYAKKLILASALGATEQVFIGRGETSSQSSQNSYFAGIVFAAAGGTPTGGDINITGCAGGPGMSNSDGDVISGAGGDSQFGWGGRPFTGESNGNDGRGYGAGGGGAAESGGGGATTGGNGTEGLVTISEFYL